MRDNTHAPSSKNMCCPAGRLRTSLTFPHLTSINQLSNWLVNFTVAFTAPLFLRASPSGPYFFFGAATLFTTAVCHFLMPETKGKSLEEIEDLFEMTRQVMDRSVAIA
jgi:hypothetical protein